MNLKQKTENEVFVNPLDWLGWELGQEFSATTQTIFYGCAYCNNAGTFLIRSECCGSEVVYDKEAGKEMCDSCDTHLDPTKILYNCPACLNKGFIGVIKDLPRVIQKFLKDVKNNRLGDTKDE